jgi:hypothetical protein
VKVSEAKAISIAEQLAEGTSIKGTARLTRTHPQTVQRIALLRIVTVSYLTEMGENCFSLPQSITFIDLC